MQSSLNTEEKLTSFKDDLFNNSFIAYKKYSKIMSLLT